MLQPRAVQEDEGGSLWWAEMIQVLDNVEGYRLFYFTILSIF